VPDVPYHIQLLFVIIMGYIWKTAFDDDYQQEYAFLSESEDAQTINKQNWWRALIACLMVLCTWSYLRPDPIDIFNPC